MVDRVHQRVLGGMGLLVLHSGHFSKIFTRLMGTTCSLAWRNSADTELVWTVAPAHPIARGVPHPIVIDEQEMYGEYFDIPAPDELVFLSTFSGGEVFRSGCCWRRGKGKVFYFSPGDQEYPVYHHPDIQRVLANAVQWARPEPETDFAPPSVVSDSPAPRLGRASRREERRERDAPRSAPAWSVWAGPASSTWPRTPTCPTSSWSAWPAWSRTRCRARRPVRRRAGAAVRHWQDLVAHGELDVVSVAAPTTLHRPIGGRRAGRRHPRAVGEADGRERDGRADDGGGRGTQRPGARRLVQPPTAR